MGTKSKWKNGILRFYNNAVVDENVVTTTENQSAINGYGLSVIKHTAAATTAGVYVLGAPVMGVTKQVIVQSSNPVHLRGSTVDNQVRFAAPTTDVNALILTPGSSYPANVSLRGVSTVLWAIVGGGAAGTTLLASGNSVLFSTEAKATS